MALPDPQVGVRIFGGAPIRDIAESSHHPALPFHLCRHDGPPAVTNVTYQVIASKLSSTADAAAATGCEMTVTLD